MINSYNTLSDQTLIVRFDYIIRENEHLVFQMKKIQNILNVLDRVAAKFQNPEDTFLYSEQVIWSDKLRKCCEKCVMLDIDSRDILSVIFSRL